VETVANAESERGHNAATAFPVYLDEETFVTLFKSDEPKHALYATSCRGVYTPERHELLNDKAPRTGASRSGFEPVF